MSSGHRFALVAIMLSVALASLDTAIANTALPAIGADLHAKPAASVWIINAYQLAMVSTLLPLAALGDIIGHRRVYISGIALFTAASLGCALSPSLTLLAIARVAQGVGGAAIMGVNSAIIQSLYPPHRLGRGLGLNALVVGTAFAAGPTVASLILSVANWPWLFAVNVPLGILAISFALPAIPHTPRGKHHFDRVAAILNVIMFAALIFALAEAAQRAPAQIWLVAAIIALVFGVLMIKREAGHPAPMLPVDLFKLPVFALSAVTAVCSFAAQGLAFVSLPFYFETVLHRSQVETGFLMTPWSVVVALAAPFAGRMSDRYAPGLLGAIGLAVLCVGMISLALLPAHPSVLDITIRMSICGAGFGFFQSPNLKAIMASAPRERSGGASGIIATARLLGQTTGAALVALSFGIAGHHGPTLALVLGAVFAGAASIVSGLRLFAPSPHAARREASELQAPAAAAEIGQKPLGRNQ
ncbi:MFS transporter [Paraburkholderia rhizosphaerae]|uniref:DHA2 family multidrug resistance protein-like MFS transporter n=1 Tax=Paraburkholderia rhizosphaerae TaxID=480658 RepID=A0A4R8LZC0_9BURK|nr:MFS transporter [Paraburkholderia rhizosphaerae]TDY53998.1 DHA2 family multidrug resistance protein-like MFS transporter [Paraburkholderia rhizosphaerae]